MKNIFLSENVRFDEITKLYTCVIKFSGIHVVQKIILITFSRQLTEYFQFNYGSHKRKN